MDNVQMRGATVFLALVAALAGAAQAAVPRISNVRHTSVTHASVRLLWSVDTASYVQVKYGISSGVYPYKSYSIGKYTEAVIAIGGLKPGTTYYFRVTARPNDEDDTDICQNDGCGAAEQVVTTAAEPAVHPELPERPATFATASPDTTGYTVWRVKNAAGGACVWSDDESVGLQEMLNRANYGTVIEFPQGITCKIFSSAEGVSLVLPAKPLDANAGGNIHSPDHRWIVLRTGGPAESLPPEGTRTGPAWAGKMARLEAQQTSLGGTEVLETEKSCSETHHYRVENLELTHTASQEVFPPDAVDPKPMGSLVQTYWCEGHAPKHLVFDRVYAHGTGFPGRLKYGLYLEGEYLAIVNSRLDRIDYWRPYEWPTAPLTLSADKTVLTIPQQSYRRNRSDSPWTIPGEARATLIADASYTGAFTGYLGPEGLTIAYTQGSGLVSCSNCTAVRMPSPAAPPNRFRWFTGTIANGRLNLQFVSDEWNTSAWVTEGSVGIMLNDGGGPYEISNNYVEAYGIAFFVDGSGTRDPSPADMLFRRNRMFWNQNHRYTASGSDGFKYLVRHPWEIKRGRRFWLDGNIFEGTWSSVTQGATISVSGRPLLNPDRQQGIADVTITNNIIRNASGGFYCMGLSMSPGGDPPVGERVLFANNLLYGIDQFEYNAGSPNGRGDLVSNMGCQDLTIRNNTFGTNVGNQPSQLVLLGAPTEGLSFADNVVYLNFGSAGGITTDPMNYFSKRPYAPIVDASSFKRILDTEVVRAGASVEPSHQFRGNVVIGGQTGAAKTALRDITTAEMATYAAQYPAGNYFPAGTSKADRERQVQFMDLGRNDYRLGPGSPYRGKAGAGGDPGADMEQLAAAVGLVASVKPVETGPDTAHFAYVAPDEHACAVDVSSDGASWLRVPDGGGGRTREVVVNALSPSTEYEYRILCYYEQVNDAEHPGDYAEDQVTRGSFRTAGGGGLDANRTLSLRAPQGGTAERAVVEFGPTAALGAETAAVPCLDGCTVTVPAAAGRKLYYRWKYLDTQGRTVNQSATVTAIAQ